MKICMIGAGYVGLVSGACFAEFGWTVICVDKDEDRVARLKRGEVPIYEPGLDELVERNTEAGRLRFSTSLAEAVQRSRARISCRRHADASRRRLCRPHLCLRGGRRDGAASRRLGGDRHQIDRPGRYQPRDRAAACASSDPISMSSSAPIPSSCAKARPSTTSPIPIAC